jgi:hypothetical protein
MKTSIHRKVHHLNVEFIVYKLAILFLRIELINIYTVKPSQGTVSSD